MTNRNKVLNSISWIVLASFFMLVALPNAQALNAGAVSITMVSSPLLILDSNGPCAGPQSAYVAFKVTNTSGGTLNNLEVTLGNMGTGFTLGGGQVAKQYIGTLANGANDVVYWFITYPCTIGTVRSLTATVNDANAGVVAASASVTTSSSISASAGGLLAGQSISGSSTIGKIIYIDVTYTFGGASNGDRYNLQPVGNSTFAAGCYQLMNAQIMASAVTAIPVGTVDKIFYTATTNQPGSGYNVTVRYFFQVLCINVPTVAKSYAGQTSGSNNIKYSGNFDSFVPTPMTANPTSGLTITKRVLSTNIQPNDLITYKVTIVNTTTSGSSIDRIEDVLPTGFTFGSTLATSDINATNANSMPVANATGTVIWSGGVAGGTVPFPYKSFYIPASDSLELFYTATVSSILGVYTNSATPYIGTTSLGTVTATVTTIKFNVSGTVFNDANGLTDGFINGTGTNAGGLFAVLVNGSNAVVQSVTIAANGTYTFTNVSAGSYTVLLSTTAGTTTVNLPTGWTSAGEGTAAAGDGTVNSSTPITLSATDITGLNFGLQTCLAASVGGSTAYSGAALCGSANSGTINLSGQTGNVVKWQTSTDGGATWSDIANTTTAYTFTNALNNQAFRAVVNNSGSCSDAFSSVTTLSISVVSVPTITLSQPTCSQPTGTITVTSPSSGVTYSFDNGATYQASATSAALTAGTYQVKVKDDVSACASASVSAILSAPTPPSVPTASAVQPTCSSATGTITVTSPSTGVSYSFDNGTTYQASATSAALNAGTYQVKVKDDVSACASSAAAITLNPQPTPPSVPTTSVTQPTCSVATGTITVTSPSSGVTYSFDNGTTYQASATSAALSAGTYQVVTKDNTSGCVSSTAATTINPQPAPPSVPVTSVTQPTCSVATGTITVTSPSSGVTYSFDDGTTYQASATSAALTAGTYNVVVKSAAGCVSSAVATTVNPQLSTPSVPTTSVTQPTCSVATGTITMTSPISGVTYSFDNGTTYQATGTSSALVAGTYQVVVKSNTSSCVSNSAATTVNPQPTTPSVPTVAISQPTCSVPTGTLTITAPTGAGMTYSIDGVTYSNTTGVFSSVVPNTYNITAKSANSCVSTAATATLIPVVTTPILSITQPTCAVATGNISVTTPLGASFTYSIGGGAFSNTTGVFSNLVVGTYTIIAKDQNGCISIGTTATLVPPILTPIVTLTQPTCTLSTGTITITTPLGSGITYSIDGVNYSNTTGIFTNVEAESYNVTAKSASGCPSPLTPVTLIPLVNFNIKVLLEGSYQTATSTMKTTMNQRGLLPGQTPIGEFATATPQGQPYKITPWNYAGTEGDTVTTYPATVVDWVLVSLKTDSTSSSNIFRVAGWLHSDGTVSFIAPCFNINNGSYFILVEHRNHVGILSANKITAISGVLSYDFTTADSYIRVNPPSTGEKLKGTKWVMMSGDGKNDTPNTNYDVNFNDIQLWKGQSGIFDQYRLGDFNLDADINFSDSFLWKLNSGKYSGVPH